METLSLEQRVALLEEEMAHLKHAMSEVREATAKPWWAKIAGTFADDPIYAEAMRLGREYRESLRSKSSRQRC